MINRSATNLSNIPKRVRLVFSTGIIFLLTMSGLRLALYLAFPRQGHPLREVLPSFLLGVRFDLRYVGILALLVLLTGAIPALDPFRKKAGRRVVLALLGTGGGLLVIFY